MARATFVKKAAKDYPEHGIKKGESYWWWSFRFGGKFYSKKEPRPSQLTQSEFASTVLALQEAADDDGPTTIEEFESKRDELVSSLQDLASETREKFDNMPEGLQQGDTGSLLEERADAVDQAESDISCVEVDFDESDFEIEREEDESDEDFEDRQKEVEQEKEEKLEEAVSSAWEEVKDLLSGIEV